jgi:inhibitor of KinA
VNISIQDNVRDDGYRIFPLGDSALTVEFGTSISIDLNERAIALAEHFQRDPFAGFIEAVPAYASTTLFYDIVAVRSAFPEFPVAFDAVASLVLAGSNRPKVKQMPRKIDIPVDFGPDAALDLNFVAKSHGLSPDEVVDIFTSVTYRVFMLGFLPGFAYMAEVHERIATPRKETPRLSVPRGSVGIAGRQTGIYSLDSPGGWQVIGRTNLTLFQPNSKDPSYLRPGDQVRFVPAR